MKALILAAGFGTRLLPFTATTPKPLFPVSGRPLLDILISSLQQAGCQEIIINTHHLHHAIDTFLAGQEYTIPVYTRYESEILGPGGAIKNVEDFWDQEPFWVINSDIVTDIPLKDIYEYHLSHNHPATLVFYDDAEFNTVAIDTEGFVLSFDQGKTPHNPSFSKNRTFTGIQVLDPLVLDFIPPDTFSSSIAAYKKLISAGEKVKAYIAQNCFWKDIGTPERYRDAVLENMAPQAFHKAFPDYKVKTIKRLRLAGDGSDRIWYRLFSGGGSLVLADHGIQKQTAVSEIDSFLAIGNHLFRRGLPVPKIYHEDTFSGLVFMEDLGDTNLQALVNEMNNKDDIIATYTSVVTLLIQLSINGARGFEPSWTYQTPRYNRELILEKECRYFIDAFINGYLGRDVSYEDLEDEFSKLAENVLESGLTGFMHRDFQSRNIMVKDRRFYFIDFQGGRPGPIQYDLASLLIDPYVDIPYAVQTRLLAFCADSLSALTSLDKKMFYRGYRYCAITRNLQILGAFGYLSRIKGKIGFEKYIPAAVKTLKHNLGSISAAEFPRLRKIAEKL